MQNRTKQRENSDIMIPIRLNWSFYESQEKLGNDTDSEMVRDSLRDA